MSATGGFVSAVLTTHRILGLIASAQDGDPRTPVLIRGEPGVGKDVLARLIHEASPRRQYSFIKVNCRTQPADCRADLFGHERGTGPLALRRRLGSFEFANRGTIYLDEVGSLPRDLVPTLVRALRTGEVRRDGGHDVSRVDVRVIASAVTGFETGHHDELCEGLRALNAVELCVPPLRERPDEIPIFASFFGEQFSRRYRRKVQLCPELIAEFRRHSWPGNLRELAEAVHCAITGASRGPQTPADAVWAS